MTERSAIEIVAAMGHELRSPLTSIRGFTKLLLDRWDQMDDPTKLELLAEVNRDAERVGRLVAELLQVARIEAGQLSVKRSPVALDEVVDRAVARVAAAFERFSAVVEPGAPAVEADEDKVEQVLLNLLENAAKYAHDGVAEVSFVTVPGFVEVRVSDRGPALDEAMLESIFELFARAEGVTGPGTGVGLWVSRQLADAHGGTLHAEPAGGGKVFILRLPRTSDR